MKLAKNLENQLLPLREQSLQSFISQLKTIEGDDSFTPYCQPIFSEGGKT